MALCFLSSSFGFFSIPPFFKTSIAVHVAANLKTPTLALTHLVTYARFLVYLIIGFPVPVPLPPAVSLGRGV